MKLRNKKTGKIVELTYHHIGNKCYESLEEVCKDWEDCISDRCYMMNKETGYVMTFDSKKEAKIFSKEVDGWVYVNIYPVGGK